LTLPPPDTTDLRTGAPIHDDLLALLPLVGVWEGAGVGVKPSDGSPFQYGQQLRFSHDGRRFLVYESRSWLLDDDGEFVRLALRETGFWRPGPGDDDFEVSMTSMVGLTQIFLGTAGDLRWQLATATIAKTPTATGVAQEARIYAIIDEQLRYVTELALLGAELQPHLNGALRRV
jgi:hypothetical protein